MTTHPPRKSIAIINDDINQLRLLEKILSAQPYTVCTFTGARQALEHIDQENPPDMIITDLFMPGIDGWRFCRLLRSPEYKAFNPIPILVVSATFSGDDADSITADTGANAFLPMPVDKNALRSTVAAMLSNDYYIHRSKALIVEDSNVFSKLISAAFESNGYEVSVAADGHQARQKIKEKNHDVIILDYHLPDLTGDRLLPEFLQKNPDAVMIMITTDPDPDLALKWLQMGASGYLRKPFAPEYLIELCTKARREKSLFRVERLLEEKTVRLHENEQLLTSILNNMTDMAWSVSLPDFKTLFISPSVEKLYGRSAQEFIETPSLWQEVTHPDDRHLNEEALARLFQNGESVRECRIIRADGSIAWIWDKSRLVYDANRTPVRIEGIVSDITARKEMEKALQLSEKRFSTVFNKNTDGFLIADIETQKFVFANPRICEMLGYTLQELLERTIEDIHPGKSLPDVLNLFEMQVRGEKEYSENIPVLRKDGSVFFAAINSTEIEFDERRCMLGMFRDITNWKNAQDKLKESEEKFSSILNSIEEVVWSFSLKDGQLIFMSSSVEQMFGRKVEEFKRNTNLWLECAHPDDIAMLIKTRTDELEGKDVSEVEHRIIRKDGSIGWIHNRVKVIYDKNGEPDRIDGLFTDITDRKEAEKALSRQLEFQRLVAEISASFVKFGSELLDDNIQKALCGIGKFFDADRSYIALFSDDLTTMTNTHEWCADGVEARLNKIQSYPVTKFPWMYQEIKKMKPVQVTSIDDLPDHALAEKRLFQEYGIKSIICFPLIVHEKLIGFMGLHSIQSEQFWGEGQRSLLWVVAEIIAGAILRKQAKDDLLRFRAAVDNSADQVFLIDADKMCFIDVNTTACNALKYAKDELLSLGPHDIKPYYTRETLAAEFDKIIHDESITGIIETVHRAKDGKEMPVEVRLQPFEASGNKWIIAAARDITERKQSEEAILQAKKEAEEANLAKSRFLSNMSHEIRTPMAGISGMIDILGKTVTNPEHLRVIDAIKASAGSLLNIINDILDLSKIEAGKLDILPKNFRLDRVLEKTVSLFSPVAAEKKLKLLVEKGDDVPNLLYGDSHRLEQILKNLVSNAIKFTHKGHVLIKVSNDILSESSFSLLFEVRDTGIGIPEELMPNLFQSFTQADSIHSKNYGGTGLGLAISRNLAERMGGRMWAESHAGVGSAFFFTIPFQAGTEEVAEQGDPVASAETALSEPVSLNILAAEDVDINQEYLSFLLNEAGHRFVMVSNGKDALQAYREQQFDLILMDIQMPEMGGIEATRQIRFIERNENRAATPIIALTAYAIKEDRDRIMEAGIDGYVTKPIDPEVLFSEIRRVMTGTLPVVKESSAETLPAQHKPGQDRPMLNMELALKRYDGNIKLWERMLHKFIEVEVDHRKELRHAVESGDFDKIFITAHTAKGSFGVICAERAMETAAGIESAAKSGDLAGCRMKVKELEEELERIKTAINGMVG